MTVMVAAIAPTQDRAASAIRIGDVFGRSLRLFAAHWAAYSGVVLIAYAPVPAMSAFGGPAMGRLAAALGAQRLGYIFAAIGLGAVIWFACLNLAHAAIFVSVSDAAAGRRASIGRSVLAVARRSPAILATLLLLWILGALLLLVPFFIVLCLCAAALPACAIEGLGPIRSIARSAFLTKGNRWRIFGLVLLLDIGGGLGSQLVIYLARMAGGASFSLLVSLAVEGVVGGFSAVAVATLYLQLRIAREGVDIEHIARVFD